LELNTLSLIPLVASYQSNKQQFESEIIIIKKPKDIAEHSINCFGLILLACRLAISVNNISNALVHFKNFFPSQSFTFKLPDYSHTFTPE